MRSQMKTKSSAQSQFSLSPSLSHTHVRSVEHGRRHEIDSKCVALHFTFYCTIIEMILSQEDDDYDDKTTSANVPTEFSEIRLETLWQ